MREEIARVVYPVLTAGLRLKDELRAGVNVEFGQAQRELLGLLQLTAQVQALVNPGDLVQGFLGLKYPLACWLDELFLMPDSPWQAQWENVILEYSLFQTRNRAWKFWEQEKLATTLGDPDALEVFYLCVVLGFRGDPDSPDAPRGDGDPRARVKAWCAECKLQIDDARPPESLGLTEKELIPKVPELNGERRVRTMGAVGIAALLVLVPLSAFLFFLQFRYN